MLLKQNMSITEEHLNLVTAPSVIISELILETAGMHLVPIPLNCPWWQKRAAIRISYSMPVLFYAPPWGGKTFEKPCNIRKNTVLIMIMSFFLLFQIKREICMLMYQLGATLKSLMHLLVNIKKPLIALVNR